MLVPLLELMGDYDPVAFPAIAGRGYLMYTTLWRGTKTGSLVEDISDLMVSGKIDLNVDRDVKLTLSIDIREPERLTAYADYLIPYFTQEFDDASIGVVTHQLGIFGIPVPPQKLSVNDSLAQVLGYDLTWVLRTSSYTDTDNVPAAAVLTTEIVSTIGEAGLTRTNIPIASTTTPVAQSFPLGTMRLDKINTLLSQLGWYTAGMDLDGSISTPGPYQALTSRTVWRTITDTDLLAPPEVQPQGDVFNQIIVINDDSASAPLYSVATNSDASSPTSTVNIGTRTRDPIHVSGVTTQAALDAVAARYLAEARTYYRVCKLKLLHDPDALVPHRIVQLSLTGKSAVLNGKWRVRTASLGLTTGTPLELEIHQVTDDIGAVI